MHEAKSLIQAVIAPTREGKEAQKKEDLDLLEKLAFRYKFSPEDLSDIKERIANA